MPSVFEGTFGKTDAQGIVVIVCSALSLMSAFELIILIFTTFRRWKSLYFFSLLIASVGLIPYTIGTLFNYFKIGDLLAADIVNNIGWVTLVNAQPMVLYSRLHLVLDDPRILRLVLWMIIIEGVIFYVSTTATHYGSMYVDPGDSNYESAFKVFEKIQMTGYCIQEFIMSGLYIKEVIRLLRLTTNPRSRQIIWHLMIVNLLIIVLDIGLLVVEYKNLRVYEVVLKGVIYAIKLKMEFAVLGKLVFMVLSGNEHRGSEPEHYFSTFMAPKRNSSSATNVHFAEIKTGYRADLHEEAQSEQFLTGFPL